jgi:hypothetical protein
MSDRPILFSGPMVRALLEGRKTQTRRVLKPQPYPLEGQPGFWNASGVVGGRICISDRHLLDLHHKPKAGDCLWVRESIGRRAASFLGIEAKNGVESAFYIADDADVVNADGFNICPWWKRKGGIPGIHMPRWASRLTLTVTDVRVQRLQEISKEDVIAEGCHERDGQPLVGVINGWHEPYAALWDTINGPGAWDANPWVVAVTFSVTKGNIDEVEEQGLRPSSGEAHTKDSYT